MEASAGVASAQGPPFFERPTVIGARQLPDGWRIQLAIQGPYAQRSDDAAVEGPFVELTAAAEYTSAELDMPTVGMGLGRTTVAKDLSIQGFATDPSGALHKFSRFLRLSKWRESRICQVFFDDRGEEDAAVALHLHEDGQDLSFFIDDTHLDPQWDTPEFTCFQTRVMFCIDHRARRGWGMTFYWTD